MSKTRSDGFEDIKKTTKDKNKKFLTKTTKDDVVALREKYGIPQDKRVVLNDEQRLVVDSVIDYKNKELFEEACACTPNRTVSRKKIWDENPQIVLKNGVINSEFDRVRTLTTKQDRHPNSGNLYFNSGIAGRSKFRYLTPRECLLFMGFSDNDYENIVNNNPRHHSTVLFPRDKIIRMAGNSIPVKLLEGIFLQITKIDKLLNP